MSTVRLRRIGREYRNERYKTISDIFPLRINSAWAPLRSRHALRESGCHRHVICHRAVVAFLVKEGNSAESIYERLCVYGDDRMGASSVRR
jgi:hypothetical protein